MTDFEAEAKSERLGQALDEYLAACEAGEPPDRASFALRFPEVAGTLCRALESLECFRMAAPALRRVAHDVIPGLTLSAGKELPLHLGDYILQRELGRGGMGIVYEAEQLSLKRRVAVKVLPLAAALDADRLKRFQVEAQIAACLEHPHIVPIHSVGYDAGLHYYVMQLIDGCSPVEWLGRQRSTARAAGGGVSTAASSVARPPDHAPAKENENVSALWYRTVADLGVQAARALAYAHEQGVVHRDIKPGNLLIDTSGKLLITDFGVALHARLPEMPLTMTGDVIGTLYYASPEQALGQRDRVDGRSDIYSLGATLYELLTGARPFGSDDRQDLIRQITCDEPPSLRKKDARIPLDLETIVLKCLAKEPSERYATAIALADDLMRFLDGRAVLARRPSVWQHARKWARRNRTILAVVSATLVVGLAAGIGMSMRWILQSYAEAQRERQKASTTARLVMEAADKTDEFATQLWHVGGTGDAQREYLRTTAELMSYLADLPDATEEARWRAARAYWRLGAVEARAMDANAAVEAFQIAIEYGEALVRDFPDEHKYQVELANFRYQLSIALSQRLAPGDREKSQQVSEQAWYELEALAVKYPRESPLREYLLNVRTAVADRWFVDGRFREAIGVLEKLREVNESLAKKYPLDPPSHIRLNGNWYRLARNYAGLKDYDEAKRCFMEAIRSDDELKKLPLTKPTDREPTWATRGVFADFLLDQGELAQAEELLVELTRDIEPLAHQVKEATWLRNVGMYYGSLGKLYCLTGRPEQAKGAYRPCADFLKGWPTQSPEFPRWLWLLSLNPDPTATELDDLELYLEQLKEQQPEHELLPAISAVVTVHRGDSSKAIEILRNGITRTEESHDRCRLQYLLAWSMAKSGQIDPARRERAEANQSCEDHDLRDSDFALLNSWLNELLGESDQR